MTADFFKVADAFKRRMERLLAKGDRPGVQRLATQMMEKQPSRHLEVMRALKQDPSLGGSAIRHTRAHKKLPEGVRAALNTPAGRNLREKVLQKRLAQSRIPHQMPHLRKRILDPRTNPGLIAKQQEVLALVAKRRKDRALDRAAGIVKKKKARISPAGSLPKPTRVRYVPSVKQDWSRTMHPADRTFGAYKATPTSAMSAVRSLPPGNLVSVTEYNARRRSVPRPAKVRSPAAQRRLERMRSKYVTKTPKKGFGKALAFIGGKLLRRGR